MYHAIRTLTALLTVFAATGLAHADGEGGPGDSGYGGSSLSAQAKGPGLVKNTKRKSHLFRMPHASAKRANGLSKAVSGAAADGPTSNTSIGTGG
jgi:hypothetical protein